MEVGTRPALLDRAVETEVLGEVVDELLGGRGSLTVIEAPPGFGKTTLCEYAAGVGREGGVEVLAARGSELGEEAPFGLARVLLRVSPSELDSAPESGPATVEQLTRELFGRVLAADGDRAARPHLLIVDDAHWIDRPSAALVAHLARRSEELPIALLVASRPDRGAGHGLLEDLERDPRARLLRPGPLAAESIAEIVRNACGDGVDPSLIEACAEASGGSPLLVDQLARELATVGPAADVETVRGIAPETVMRGVLSRLARLGAAPAALAEAAAILDGSGTLDVAARLAGLSREEAEEAADELAAAGLLAAGEPLVFPQPLIATALRAEMGAFVRSRAHARAAAALAAADAPAEEVAAQLLHAPCEGSRETVDRLREAAALAGRRGDPAAAVRLLERALAEGPPDDERAGLLVALAEAEASAGSPRSLDHFSAAVELIEAPAERAGAHLELARTLHHAGEFAHGAEIAAAGLEALGDADEGPALELETAWIAAALLEPSLWPELGKRLQPLIEAAGKGEPPASPALCALLSSQLAARDAPVELVESLALAAFAEDPLVDGDSRGTALGYALFGLWAVDALDSHADHAAAAAASASERGAVIARSVALNNVAMGAVESGDLEAAVRSAEDSFEIYRFGWTSSPWSTPSLVLAHVGRGELDFATKALELGEAAGSERPEYLLLLEARAQLRLAEGRFEEALDDALEGDRLAQSLYGATSARLHHWFALAAEAAQALGRTEEAREHAAEAVRRGRAAGTGRAVGTALTAAGVAAPREQGTTLLTEAATALADSPSRYRLARALLELGSARALEGEEASAEGPLLEALELADEFGAQPLVVRARRELAAIGRRPRRAARRGVEALTPSELRVAGLAAEGHSTPQIAHRLHITRKTVESHLGQTYRKLEISGRDELAEKFRDSEGKVRGGSP